MTKIALIEAPSPFAPTKELQDFLARWKDSSQAKWDPALQSQLKTASEGLLGRKDAS
jgi:hypothetical protein